MEGYMRPIITDESVSQNPIKLDVIPAPLHDASNEVFDDKLYTLYTTQTKITDNVINVSIIASDLVKHTASNGVSGYWVGIGINNEVIADSDIYVGWEQPNEVDLGERTHPDGNQVYNEELYQTFYFNAETASKHSKQAYVVVIKDSIHYHYNIDFSQVNLKTAEPELDEVNWSSVSVDNLINNYLFGIDLSDASGNPLPRGLFIHYLNSATEYLSNLLDINITDQTFEERHDYYRNDYTNWGFIQLDHNPVKEVKSLQLMYGGRPSVDIPLDWIQLDKLTGQITLFPAAGSANTLIIGQTGMLFGFQSQWDYAPSLWKVEYISGIDENDKSMPLQMLMEAVYKRASCGILNVWGDLIIGAGIASQSVSLDGLSQSIGTTQSAMFGGASARVENYTKDLKEQLLPALRQKFGGIRMVVV